MTPAQIGTYLGGAFQPRDADLDSLAAASATNSLYYRSAPSTWSPVTLGSNLTLSGSTLSASTNPGTVTSVSAAGSNGITASVASAGTTPAIAIGLGTVAIANGGTGATTGAGALSALGAQAASANLAAIAGLTTSADNCGYWTAASAASLYACPSFGRSLVGSGSAGAAQSTLGLGSAALASTGASGHVLGYLDGTNTYSGMMTFSQPIAGSVTGNAGTATKLATPRTINGVSFDGSGAITVNAVDSTARLAASANLSDVASLATARANLGAAAAGANADIGSLMSGKIGIGTISPGGLLDVSGAGGTAGGIIVHNSSAGSYAPVTMFDNRNSSSYVAQFGLYGTSGSSPGTLFIYNTAGGSISFYNGSGSVPANDLRMSLTATNVLFNVPTQIAVASTVANLPTCNAAARGTRTVVTDASMPMFLAALSGGGSTVSPAFCNGSAWVAG